MEILSSFVRERRGSVALAFGLSLVGLALFVGLAIDTARVFSITRKVQTALDAAALAGAKALNESDGQNTAIQAAAYATFVANTAGIGNSEAIFTAFSAVPDTANSAVSVGVRIQVPATFAKLAGLNEFDVHKTAGTSYSLARIEVALALDVTGSMNDIPPGDTVTKLAAMKSAAARLVDTLFADATTDSNVRIAVVPWSSGVLAGAYKTAVTGSASGDGCIVERAGSGATTDSLPDPVTYALSLPASSLAVGYACPNMPVSPLKGRQKANNIKNDIQSLLGAGGTAGHMGGAWAWYMLSPTWTSLHPVASRPEPPSRNVIKVAVIMTDGIFNTTHVGGMLNTNTYNDQSYTIFKTLCDGMIAQGIRVYTVAFDVNDIYALGKLSECSGASNSLTAANSTQLDTAFHSIATELNSIRITR